MRINWGTAIAGVYITFAIATVSFVVFAVGRPVELVSADYYEQSLKHDAHRHAIANAEALGDAVRIAAAEDAPAIEIAVGMPAEVPRSMPVSDIRGVTGTVTLYRPSDRTADRVVPLSLDHEGRQRIRVEGAAHGRWTVKLSWRAGQQDFYRERIVWLP
jgi:hypothetical protein